MAEKLDKLLAQQELLKARIAKEKAKTKQQARKADTRRKILVGSVIQKHMEQNPDFRAQVNQLLEKHLTKPIDRALFNLEPKEVDNSVKASLTLQKLPG